MREYIIPTWICPICGHENDWISSICIKCCPEGASFSDKVAYSIARGIAEREDNGNGTK
jgi:hypothetical protein